MPASIRSLFVIVVVLIGAGRVGFAWDLPADNGTLGRQAIAEILAGTEYPETGSYTLKRWRVTKVAHGDIREVPLRPDTKALQPIVSYQVRACTCGLSYRLYGRGRLPWTPVDQRLTVYGIPGAV